MDLQKKLDIALKLLEYKIGMDGIRSCPLEMLVRIAQRINVAPKDLEAFAEEFAQRNSSQAKKIKAGPYVRSGYTILLTDDQSCITRTMESQPLLNIPLSDCVLHRGPGFQVEFRLRDKGLAERCSRVLDQKIEVTDEPLPQLKEDDIVMHFPKWQHAKGPDHMPIINRLMYRP